MRKFIPYLVTGLQVSSLRSSSSIHRCISLMPTIVAFHLCSTRSKTWVQGPSLKCRKSRSTVPCVSSCERRQLSSKAASTAWNRTRNVFSHKFQHTLDECLNSAASLSGFLLPLLPSLSSRSVSFVHRGTRMRMRCNCIHFCSITWSVMAQSLRAS